MLSSQEIFYPFFPNAPPRFKATQKNAVATRSKTRHGIQQTAGVFMTRTFKDLFCRTILHYATAFHHHNTICHIAHHGKIMRNENHGQPHGTAQIVQQIQNLRLDRHIESRYGFIGQHKRGLRRNRARNRRTLPLSSRKLMRILMHPCGIKPDPPHQLRNSLLPFFCSQGSATAQRLCQHISYAEPWIE